MGKTLLSSARHTYGDDALTAEPRAHPNNRTKQRQSPLLGVDLTRAKLVILYNVILLV